MTAVVKILKVGKSITTMKNYAKFHGKKFQFICSFTQTHLWFYLPGSCFQQLQDIDIPLGITYSGTGTSVFLNSQN